ncbi:MAG: phospholipid carrier-dependent glycosyltransferase [Anaerolineaceae bacterium]|nr:phospholipid carrier-dependent glycosyltransferase [Anaerolineaceae bacterium]
MQDYIENKNKANAQVWQILFIFACVILILIGVYFRFAWRNWSEGANLHPDEYGLTNTLTQLALPVNFSEYINTRVSPISPYNRYDDMGTFFGNGPDNRMRWGQWPIIIIRTIGELTKNTGYDEIRLLGRSLSAIADFFTLVILFFIGKRLFNWQIGLLATTFGALSVLQIQQSHFMTVDTFALLFTTFTIYACIRISEITLLVRNEEKSQKLQINSQIWTWLSLFGVGFGMAVASKINLAILAGMLPVAVFVSMADIKLQFRDDLKYIIKGAMIVLVAGALTSFLVFRLTQPMSFRAVSRNTTLLTLRLNPDWVDSMKVAQMESSGIGGGPPAEQWTHRVAIMFPLRNMVFWGFGVPLGVAAWAAVLAAAWLLLRNKIAWRKHLIPLGWTLAFFLFMGTRWVKSMRYFLPIYPLLCLYAAWGILSLLRKAHQRQDGKRALYCTLGGTGLFILLLGTFLWANSFTTAVYANRHTRIRTTEWMFQHIPGAVNYIIETRDGEVYAPFAVSNQFELSEENGYSQSTRMTADGRLVGLFFPRIQGISETNQSALIAKYPDVHGETAAISVDLSSVDVQENIRIDFDFGAEAFWVVEGQPINLELINESDSPLILQKITLSNESWDEGLPVRFNNWDPFGQLYIGNTMEVRWMDDENKKNMFLETIDKTDYIIVPSQRAVWSASRMPLMYPLTMKYYEALFTGQLGYELIAEFQAPMKFADLYVSDVGGMWSFGTMPDLPIFNFNPLAAEEAFSVYDHPPAWIFRKTKDYDPEKVKTILDSIDLNQVIIQSPRDATFFITQIKE